MTVPTQPASPGPGPTIPLDERPAPEQERTLTLEERLSAVVERSASLVNRSWILNADSNGLHTDVVNNHTDLVAAQLEASAQERAGAGAGALLADLANEGFAWVDIARLVNVSVPAVRKWRTGGSPSPEKLVELARIVALIEWLRDEKLIQDVVSWLEIPLAEGVPTSRMDILQSGGRDLLVRSLVGEGLTQEAVLDQLDPEWRARHASDFEVFTAADGQLSIRRAAEKRS